MNIFVDFHHQDLLYSLQLLFEKRLGHNLFTPIGMQWAEEKFWLIHEPYNYNLDTAKQYLDLERAFKPQDGTPILNHVEEVIDECYIVEDKHNQSFHKGLEFETFKEMDIDIIIASVPAHWKSFTRLRDMYHPGAKVICHMGNHFVEVDNMIADGTIKNLMASTIPFPVSCNAVFYHQEFDTDIFTPSSDAITKRITSFINVYHHNIGSANFYALKSLLPNFAFRSFGASCDDGILSTTRDLAHEMQKTMFTFMVKAGADGYGHVLHNSFACGTPVIINYNEYKDKLGGKLLIPGETCLVSNIDENVEQIASTLLNMNENTYGAMRQRTYEVFKEQVDFDKEQEKIEVFLSHLN